MPITSHILFLPLFPTVEKIQNQWDEVQGHIQNRRQQLHEMLKDSRQWLEAKQEAEQILECAKTKVGTWKEISYTVEGLKKQNAELKVLVINQKIRTV